jgi:type III restriction enzyme
VLDGGWSIEASPSHAFEFGAAYPVPANRRYDGKFRFAKHHYPVVASLRDGGEEWQCAMAIEHHSQIVRWVRNLDSDPVAGFWLPTSFGRFYPDFICALKDGRVLVVEYKGAPYATLPKEVEKGEVGALWARRSSGRCLFAMVLKDRGGLNVAQQIDAAIS